MSRMILHQGWMQWMKPQLMHVQSQRHDSEGLSESSNRRVS